jgi:hypothetical protein
MDKSITVRRLKMIDANRSVYSATGTANYPASWQETSVDTIQMLGGQIGDLYSAYVDLSCPAEDGDQIVKDGIIYGVRDSREFDFGAFSYKRLVVVRGV